MSGLSVFPERGTLRDDVRDGQRIIGFERNASVAFIVEDESVIVLRILGKGQEFRQANTDWSSVSRLPRLNVAARATSLPSPPMPADRSPSSHLS
ncbi:hypothetical protein [Agrobacterium cavarae]|uniref:hypothetical protein n=1 Tax=Agrobacterium cavarae TaxID=2528239 RepID=UPI0028985FAE|nr:hypothetical protein [Agrobacterium cavarae]